MRSLVLAALLACSACDTETSPTAAGDAHANAGGDVLATQDAPVLRDTSDVDIALACEVPAITQPVVLGRDDARWCFEVLPADAMLTIVRGIQGGIHVEVRLALTLAVATPEAPPIEFEVEVVHDGSTIARFASSLVHLQSLRPANSASSSWATAAFPVVFASADASLYAALPAELRARVVLLEEAIDLKPVPVYLVAPP